MSIERCAFMSDNCFGSRACKEAAEQEVRIIETDRDSFKMVWP